MSFAFIQKIFPPNLAYRNFIFIPLFFVFYIVIKTFEPSAFLLQNFSGRNISIATYEGIDIGERVSLFYKAIGFTIVLLFLMIRLTIIIKNYFNTDELILANGISLAGFCLLFFQLLGADMADSFHFIFSLLIICLAGFVSHLVKKRDDRDFITTFLWTILISISIFFLQWQVSIFAIGKNIFSLPKILVFVGVPLYLLFTSRFHLNYKLLQTSKPFIFFPLLSFLAIELYMIFNQHGFYVPPKIIYGIGLILIILISFIQNRRQSFPANHKPLLSILFKNWMPLMIAGIAIITFYEPIVKPDIDWFEDANRVLPLHQLFSFGKIPLIDSFNSHALSDFGAGVLYSVFNGADPMGIFVYRFLIGVIFILITYFFIYKISGDGFLATWIALAYPYTSMLIPDYFNFVPLSALAFILLYEKQTIGRYVFFFSTLIFMLVWRIDLGSSTLIAGIISLLFLIFFVPTFKTKKKFLFFGFGIPFIISMIVFIAVYIYSGSAIFVALNDSLAYMSSFQSYGLKDLAILHDYKYYSLYFIFPCVIILIFFYNAFKIVRQSEVNKTSIYYSLALCFLCLFYLSNLQRGLVRHTLAEQWDTAFTSFGFFIISSVTFIQYFNKNIFLRFFIFFIASTLLISNYVFTAPELNKNNNYKFLTLKLNNPLTVPLSRNKINRITENPSNVYKYFEFSEWMKNNFTAQSTFLDFSNTPMLYYFSNRIVPNYFDQIPHTAHNEYLQKRFIDDLNKFDIPVAVFSNVPLNFWDNLDGIPNTLRHYRISEYIYRNYKPTYIINNHSVWVKNNLQLKNNITEIFSVPFIEFNPTNDTLIKTDKINFNYEKGNWNCQLKNPLHYGEKKIYMSLDVASNKDGELIIMYKSLNGNFNDNQKSINKIHKGLNTIFLMFNSLENEKDLSNVSINVSKNDGIKINLLKIFSSDYYPDNFSALPSEYSLKWIPYIWGSFDKNFQANSIIEEQKIYSGNKIIHSGLETKFDFSPLSEKEMGNYVLITARTTSEKQTEVKLNYGDNEYKNGSFHFALKNDSINHNYLVRISAQYNWYCKNNSWISILPVGNDIELTNVRILKGD